MGHLAGALIVGVALVAGCADARSDGEGPGPTMDGDGPAPTTRVGFVPGDLTTNVGADSALRVALTDLGSAPVTDAQLEAGLAMLAADGSSVPGTAMFEPDDFIPRVGFRPDAPMADGWYEVRFTAPPVPWTFVSDLRTSLEVDHDVFVARVRIGSQPFLRGATVCGTGGEREPVVDLDFSESVLSLEAGSARVLDEAGAVVCTVPLSEEAASMRFECAGLDPGRPLAIELPLLASPSGETLQAGPAGGSPPARYEITPTSFSADDSCLWYLLAAES